LKGVIRLLRIQWKTRLRKFQNMADTSNSSSTGGEVEKSKTCSNIKHDWYQTESHVVIIILAKNTKEDNVKVEFGSEDLAVAVTMADGSDYQLKLSLAYPVIPGQCVFKVTASKIEITLKKRLGLRWTTLESDVTSSGAAEPIAEATSDAGPPKYPSSAPRRKDWDRLVGDIIKEEGTEKDDGVGALDVLFQQMYSQGTDEMRRAMNKSFQESGGTVLSTNWKEVSREKVEMKVPDDMEWRRWEQ
jgi:suppressor of G2 allele of SKP1